MWIQIILVVGIVVGGFFLIRNPGGDTHLAMRRLTLALFVIAAILSVVFPEWLTWLAQLVGVGRGTDLLLYAFVLVFLVFVTTQYRRNVATNRRITLLARRLALDEAFAAERDRTGREDVVPGDARASNEQG